MSKSITDITIHIAVSKTKIFLQGEKYSNELAASVYNQYHILMSSGFVDNVMPWKRFRITGPSWGQPQVTHGSPGKGTIIPSLNFHELLVQTKRWTITLM